MTGLLSRALWSFLFGVAQYPLAVVAPDLERLADVSAGGALASLLYASAAVAASARVVVSAAKGGGGGGGGGATAPPPRDTGSSPSSSSPVWSALDAVSTILFAFGGHFVLPEIAASLDSSPSSSSPASSPSSSSSPSPSNSPTSPMVPAVKASYLAVALSYFSVAAFGAAAFGESVADDVLLSRGAGPAALVAVANAAVCFHVAAGFHVFSQPCYSRFEGWFEKRWFGGGGGAASFSPSLPGGARAASSLPLTPTAGATAEGTPAAAASPSSSLPSATSAFAAAARLCYVLSVSTAAAALPSFSVCMSLVGALAFAPATFVLPPAFAYFSRGPSTSRRSHKRRRTFHGAMALVFGALSLACSVSAARGLAVALQERLRGLAV